MKKNKLAVLTSCLVLSGTFCTQAQNKTPQEIRIPDTYKLTNKSIYRNGWIDFNKNGKKDVYEDPIFTITFETTKADQYWKIIPKANVDAGNTDASAAGVVGPKVDGEDSMTGSLTNGDAKAGKIAKAGKYKLTLNMMDYTYTFEEVKYDPFIYFIGATDGWKSSDQKLALVDEAKGVYTGYVYVADPNGAGLQFKFQRVAGSWDNEINAGAFVSFGGAATNENGNIGVNAGEGVYYFDVNLCLFKQKTAYEIHR